MPILATLTNFCDFYDFRTAAAIAFLAISKIPRVNFEIRSFSCYFFKNCCSVVTQACALGSWI